MAIVRGQWYQWKIYPDRFYRVNYLYSNGYVQLLPLDSSAYSAVFNTQTYIQTNFRLLTFYPQYMLLNGGSGEKLSKKRAYGIAGPFITATTVGPVQTVHAHAMVDTRLKGKGRARLAVDKARLGLTQLQISGSLQAHAHVYGNFVQHILTGSVHAVYHGTGRIESKYPLGGHVAAQGRVVQAQAN